MTTPGPCSFNYAQFVAAYPEFVACSEPQLQNYFDMSGAFFANDTCNPAFGLGVDRMTRIAWMATAHIAFMMAPRDASGRPSASGKPAPGTVGQLTSASEGSVSASFAEVAKGGSELAAWWAQTPYGFMFWQATAQFRQAVYMANPTVVPSSINPLFPQGAAFGRFPWREKETTMDHDSDRKLLHDMKAFLDSEAPGWRNRENWGRRRSGLERMADHGTRSPDGSELVVDEDKTKADREALGFTDQTVLRQGRPFTPAGPTQGLNPGVDDGKDAEIRRNARAGKGAVNNETLAQQERAELLSRMERFRGQEGVPELTGEESNDELRRLVQGLETPAAPGSAANEVALEEARANPAAEQALKTSQDPERQARAEEQQAAKRDFEAGKGGPAPQA